MRLPRLSLLPHVPGLLKRRPRIGSGNFYWDFDEYVSGNALTLYSGGDALFPAMTAAIEGAQKTIHLETYIFGGDVVGRFFAELLARKSREGVRVRLIFDSVGSIDLDPVTLTTMRNAGVQTLEYHPVAPWRPRWAWNRRDHRKILICDGRIGFVGGINICDENAPTADGGGGWRDTHARVEGPAAYDLDRLFRAVWYHNSGRWFESAGNPATKAGPANVRVAANQELLRRFVIREAYLNALRAARHEVSIENAYFIPGSRIRRALAAAARRGVQVRVLVPGQVDSAAVGWAMRAKYGWLLARGVRIFEWQGPMMHSKAVVVDRHWCSIGSFNLDRRSLVYNLEVNLNVINRPFAAELADAFQRSLENSREILLADWRRRPVIDRVMEKFWSAFDLLF